MRTPPPEVIAAARLITEWAAKNNIKQFAICGIQQRANHDPDPRPLGLERAQPPAI